MGGCAENVRSSSKMCGSRQPTFASGLQYAQSLPGEFPWTCLILNQNNDFVGSCAVIPNDFSNDNGRPTRKILTAAHKLKDVGRNDLLKVRVGEWDASGFNSPEQVNHQEYTVVRILKHPQFNAGRLDNDLAILYTDRNIEINSSPWLLGGLDVPQRLREFTSGSPTSGTGSTPTNDSNCGNIIVIFYYFIDISNIYNVLNVLNR